MMCSFCSGEKAFKFSNGVIWISSPNGLHGEVWSWSGEDTYFREDDAINYCPNCGRELKELPKE